MTYTYTYETDLERGAHALQIQVNNIWQIVSSDEQTIHASYDLDTHGIGLYQGDRRINAWGIHISDTLLPDLPSLTFESDETLVGQITAIVRERGIRRYQFSVRYAQKQAGFTSYTAEAAETDILREEQDWIIPAGQSDSVVASLASSLRLSGEENLTGDIGRQQQSNQSLSDILVQILTANNCVGSVRDGTLYIYPLSVSSKTAVHHITKDDVSVSYSEDSKTYKRVRAHYANAMYPVPQTSLTEFDAGNWTGTVSNVSKTTAEGIRAKSGAGKFLKATTAITRASLATSLNDFDRFRLNWKPDTATSLAIKLEKDASNYLSYTRAFSGGYGEGFTVTGSSADDTGTTSITTTGHRIVSVSMRFSAPCSARLKLLDSGGTVLYTGAWGRTYGETNDVVLTVPDSEYKSYTPASMTIEVTGLYVVGTGFGAECTSFSIDEYVEQTEWIPYETPNDMIVRRITLRTLVQSYGFGTARGTVVGQGLTTKLYKIDFGAAPSIASGEEIKFSGFQKNVWVKGTWWDTVTTHTRVEDIEISPAYCIENGRIVGYFSVSFTNAASATPGDLYLYEWVYDKYFETIVWIVQTGAGSAGTWGSKIWVIKKWGRASSYKQWDEIDIPLASFAKTGSPTSIVSITLTATGTNYYDVCCLYASSPIPRQVEAGSGMPLYDVRGITFGSYASAMAYAQGLLTQVATPVRQYQKDVGLINDMGLGSVVCCDGENMVIQRVELTEATKMVSVGRQVETYKSAYAAIARRIDAVEKIIL